MAFLESAALLGLDVEKLKAGEVIRTVVAVGSIDKFREIFAGSLSDADRAVFAKDMTAGADRRFSPFLSLANYIFGTGSLSPADQQTAARVFPLKVGVVAGLDITIDKDEAFGPGEPPATYFCNNLTFKGGSISATCNVLSITVSNTLTVLPGTTKQYHVGIFGAQGDTGKPGSAGKNGDDGQNGDNVSAPTPGICTGAAGGGNATDGKDGDQGNQGNTGSNGIPNQIGTIGINAVAAGSYPLILYTVSGPGGVGGVGGRGGEGGDGGDGGHGCDSGCECTDGGRGGNGGRGGQGGVGGKGGNGSDGNAIQVTFPRDSKSLLQMTQDIAVAGPGGDGGYGGSGGSGGSGGGSGSHCSDGTPGQSRDTGPAGDIGPVGDSNGAPGSYNVTYT